MLTKVHDRSWWQRRHLSLGRFHLWSTLIQGKGAMDPAKTEASRGSNSTQQGALKLTASKVAFLVVVCGKPPCNVVWRSPQQATASWRFVLGFPTPFQPTGLPQQISPTAKCPKPWFGTVRARKPTSYELRQLCARCLSGRVFPPRSPAQAFGCIDLVFQHRTRLWSQPPK